MSGFGYTLPSQGACRDGEYTPNTGRSLPIVRVFPDSDRSTPSFGRGQLRVTTPGSDPEQK